MSKRHGKDKEVPASLPTEYSSDSDSSSASDYESVRQSASPQSKARLLAAKSILQYQPISNIFLTDGALLLDFACGTGALSQHLASHIDRILGIDVDLRAVQEFNTRARNQGIDEIEMHAIHCDVLNEDSLAYGKTWFGKVDVVASALGFHHLADMTTVTKTLVNRFLKVGGWIAVIDLMYEPHTSVIFENAKKVKANHPDKCQHGHDHLHHYAQQVGGIKANDIRHAFESAGLDCVDVFERVFDTAVIVPRRLIPEYGNSNEAGSSRHGRALSSVSDGGKVEVLLPFLLAVGKKS
ncbi:S-adenosyl-L-methionine-dependent methyltransferase [Lipomyces kononenkoae]|uniref:S-adenosyl-L-methionine-dependent methyltransferase n=1 Tax=Lipomyces kononenkoae TaxID=34357 RepID=A0ACC3STZ2_LIPKO